MDSATRKQHRLKAIAGIVIGLLVLVVLRRAGHHADSGRAALLYLPWLFAVTVHFWGCYHLAKVYWLPGVYAVLGFFSLVGVVAIIIIGQRNAAKILRSAAAGNPVAADFSVKPKYDLTDPY
ncbi:MAG: hypothetical protein AAGD22_14960 [Verrucomicrobiota bacterium]